MPGAGIYRVGLEEDYDTIQAALDALVVDQGATEFAAEQSILIADSRTYGPFTVSGLTPTDVYPLTIAAVAGESPVVSGRQDPANAWTGVLIDGVDFVEIEDLVVRDFARGVVAVSCSEPVLRRCRVHRNQVVGVFLHDCVKPRVAASAISESGLLLSVALCTEAMVLQSSLVNQSTQGNGVLLTPPRDAGQYAVDNPLHFYNNVVSCTRGTPLVLPQGFEQTMVTADGNVYHSGSGVIAELREDHDRDIEGHLVRTMEGWRDLTGSEANSRFVDPVFLLRAPAGLPKETLELDWLSPLAGAGQPLVSDPGQVLPFEVEFEDIDTDILGRGRVEPPTPGCHELLVSADFDFLGFFGDTTVDAEEISGLDRAARQLQAAVDAWYPRVHRGHFFVHDAPFYLYADKNALYLREVTWTEFELDLDMKVSGVEFGGAAAEFLQIGRRLLVSHAGTGVLDEVEGHVRVVGVHYDWDDATYGLLPYGVERTLLPRDGRQRYLLPSDPLDGAPIVVTDDTVSLAEPRDLVPYEFYTERDPETELVELHLHGALNRVHNADFHYVDDTLPRAWEVGTSEHTVECATSFTDTLDVIPRAGHRLLRGVATAGHETSAFVEQEVPLFEDEDAVLSFHLSTQGVGALQLQLTALDVNRNVLGGDVQTFVPESDTSLSEWRRYAAFVRTRQDSDLDVDGISPDVWLDDLDCAFAQDLEVRYLRVGIAPVTSATTYLDAVQLTEGQRLERFSRLPYGDGATIEYERSDERLYDVSDLGLSPVVNPQHTGFLTVGPVRASQFDTSAPEDATTLWDHGWATGRVEHLPWSRLRGPHKYLEVPRGRFGRAARGLGAEIGFDPALPEPRTITLHPDPVVVSQDGETGFYARVRDQFDNPYPFETVTLSVTSATYGQVGLREMGVPSQLGAQVSTHTDPSGTVAAQLLGPGSGELQYVGPALTSEALDVPHAAWRTGHANVRVRLAGDLSELDPYGPETSETVALSEQSNLWVGTSTHYPAPGTLRVEISDTSTWDRPLEVTWSDQFDSDQAYHEPDGRVVSLRAEASQARLTYRPRRIWVDPLDERVLRFDSTIRGEMTDDVIVDYDIETAIWASIELPDGSGTIEDSVDLVLRRPV